MSILSKKYRRHILFWFIYILFEAYVEFAWIKISYPLLNPFYRFYIAFLAEFSLLFIKIPVVYFLFHIINFWSEKSKAIEKTILSIALLFCIGAILHRYIIIFIDLKYIYPHISGETSDSILDFSRITTSFLDLIFVSGTAYAIKQYRQQLLWKSQEKELIKQKLETELNFLKAQTNPHFLFNTLNNIYALAKKNSNQTADIVLKLSKILRYILYETTKSNIPIYQEIEIIQDYIELEKIRYNKRLKIEFNVNMDNINEPIAPLLLLPFIENAFKHGASESRFDTYILINLELNNHKIKFEVENSKEEMSHNNKTEKNIGLKNIKRQLELTYPSHELYISNQINHYKIILKINLKTNERI